jgi:sulfide:quinone oxidoreductase
MDRVVVLGAGFGGLELATVLSDEFGEDAGVTLIDAGDAFVFGYSKLDVMFGRVAPAGVRLRYTAIAKPGVRLQQERITAIDPETRRVTTDAGFHEADVLVIALGADYDLAATPGVEGHEFYSVAGAERMRDALSRFTGGHAIVDDCEISLVMPFPSPVPPSPDTSAALLEAFAERGIEFVPERRLAAYDHGRGTVALDDGSELACDLLLGVPRHRAPAVVLESGLAADGYVPVDGRTLETRVPGVYAVGDVATVGVPKAGVLAERQARVVAAAIAARRRGEEPTEVFDGRGACYVEFGVGRVGRVDIDFFSGPKPVGTLQKPSPELVAEKREFDTSRRARWFGL